MYSAFNAGFHLLELATRPPAVSCLAHGSKLLVGGQGGSLTVLEILQEKEQEDRVHRQKQTFKTEIRLGRTIEKFSPKSIDRLLCLKELAVLVVLSNQRVSLYDLNSFQLQMHLEESAGALSVEVHTGIELAKNESESSDKLLSNDPRSPVVVSRIAVALKRKVLVWTWQDGILQSLTSHPLPYTAKSMVFINQYRLALGFSHECALFDLETSALSELFLPMTSGDEGTNKNGATSSLGEGLSYLGFTRTHRPILARLPHDELAITSGTVTTFLQGTTGLLSRRSKSLHEWSLPPESVSYVYPYLLGLIGSTIEVRDPSNLALVQTILLGDDAGRAPNVKAFSFGKQSFIFTTSPDGIWCLTPVPYPAQICQMLRLSNFQAVKEFVDVLDDVILEGKTQWQESIRLLTALHHVKSHNYEAAVKIFMERPFHIDALSRDLAGIEGVPALATISLFPAAVSGRYQMTDTEWITKYVHAPGFGEWYNGGDALGGRGVLSKSSIGAEGNPERSKHRKLSGLITPATGSRAVTAPLTEISAKAGDVSYSRKSSAGKQLAKQAAFKTQDNSSSSAGRRRPVVESDHASIASASSKRSASTDVKEHSSEHFERQAVSSLILYLTDRRTKLFREISKHGASGTHPALIEEATLVDTALFKAYAFLTPSLIGPLVRTQNYCDIAECEKILKSGRKWNELVELYRTGGRHVEAMSLLKQLAEQDEDAVGWEDWLRYCMHLPQREFQDPSIQQQLLNTLKKDMNLSRRLFTAEDSNFYSLQPQDVLGFLCKVGRPMEMMYLEFLIQSKNDTNRDHHNRLGVLFLEEIDAVPSQYAKELSDPCQDFMVFLKSSLYYSPSFIFHTLPHDTPLLEAKAICLGRLRKHDEALTIFVRRLHDPAKAENWCDLAIDQNFADESIFIKLLYVYVRHEEPLLDRALDLLGRRGPLIDTSPALAALPALVHLQDVLPFLIHRSRVSISTGLSNALEAKLLQSENQRLKRIVVVQPESIRFAVNR